MAELLSEFQPNFALFPRNNNRTGWQPVNIPLLLVTPHVRSADGIPINNANVCELAYFIEDAPGKTPVAAQINQGIFVPDFERFRIKISSSQLASVRLDVTGRRFFDANGNEKTFEEAENGDFMEYGMLRGPIGAFGQSANGPIDTVPFLKHAEYYDLSSFIIETVDLPNGKYNFVYQARFFKRIISPDGEFVCIDDSKKILARHATFVNHPGDLHEAMVNNTPAFYFESPSRDQDPTIAFYRPFADALQDIFDEQELLKGVNWVDKIPTQYIPYLSYLLGLDMPYFATTTDNIRKALLKNGRKLQQLKGSERAIRELFEIFGFAIDVTNLWYSKNGKRFIAPNEKLPDDIADQEITTETVCHAEPMLNAFATPGFGQVKIPLLFRPLENITVDGWLVEEGSDADLALAAAVNATANDVEAFITDQCAMTIQGFQFSTKLQSVIPTNGVIGHSVVLLDQQAGGIDEVITGQGPLSIDGLNYDNDRNSIDVSFDHYLSLGRDKKLYVFATYERVKIILPPDLADLRSNRFDIDVLTFKNGKQPSSDVFQFLLEFLFKFKAFHSLLRKIVFAIEVEDVYNVIDFCAGGTYAQSPFKDAGQLQQPPPAIPNALSTTEGELECSDEGILLGSKDNDTFFRSKILSLLEEEHAAWKRLDGTHDIPDALLPILQSASRLKLRSGTNPPCEFNTFGQDRVVDSNNKDFDHIVDDRDKLCSLDGNTLDYCYKGRVQQELDVNRVMLLEEIFRCKPCTLSGGAGTYFMTPLILNNEFSGGDSGENAVNLGNIEHLRRSHHDGNYVRIMAFDNPQIHYTNRDFLDENTINNRFFATQKPSLEISKDTMFMPGHRFISMANLKNDFMHPDYFFRPWDYLFCIACPEDLPVTLPELNAHLVRSTDGDDYLSIDPYPLIYYGNGVDADIPQMNDHALSLIDNNDVTHSIWSSASPGLSFMDSSGSSTKYVIDQKDDGLRYPVEALGIPSDTICFTDILGPLFESANKNCNCDDIEDAIPGRSLEDILPEPTSIFGGTGTSVNLTGGSDFIDGYPSDFGLFNVNLTQFDFPREKLEGYGFSVYGISKYAALISAAASGPSVALGIPINATEVVELKFRVGSGVKVLPSSVEHRFYHPLRMDCEASFFECPPEGTDTDTGATNLTNLTGVDLPLAGGHGVLNFGVGNFGADADPADSVDEAINRCPLSLFQLADGSYDWNCDQIILTPKMILNDQYGAISCLMDGSIPNMMSFDDTKAVFNTIATAFEIFPEEGNYQFIDDYGIIHSGIFETLDDRLDITTRIQDPRVWGKEPSGVVRNYKVFRDGIITTERQIIQVADFGFIIIAEGGDQKVERFQTTFGCGDEIYEDPFAFHLNANLVDDVNIIITPSTTSS